MSAARELRLENVDARDEIPRPPGRRNTSTFHRATTLQRYKFLQDRREFPQNCRQTERHGTTGRRPCDPFPRSAPNGHPAKGKKSAPYRVRERESKFCGCRTGILMM